MQNMVGDLYSLSHGRNECCNLYAGLGLAFRRGTIVLVSLPATWKPGTSETISVASLYIIDEAKW